MGEGSYVAGGGARRPWLARARDFVAGSDTPRAFLERCIETIEAREGQVQAFAALDLDAARAAADAATARWAAGEPLSPLDGCPVGVKDIIHTRTLPTQMGSALYAGWQAPEDAAAVAALTAAGAVVVGKTHTTEFAVGASPPTRNPWQPDHTPGGSSSGSAAAVGCGMLPLALGTQTMGSILRPASFCGAVGYKPSLGALPLGGVHPLSATLDHLGPLAAGVDDAWAAARIVQEVFGGAAAGATPWLLGDAPARTPARLARLRVEGDADLEPDAAAAFDGFVDALRARGVTVLEAAADAALRALQSRIDGANALCLRILRYEMRWPLSLYAARAPDAVGQRILDHLAGGAEISFAAYREDLAARDTLRREVAEVAAAVDGFLLPSASGPAPEGHAFTGARTMLGPWSVIGGPAWSLPLLAVGGLPFGVQLAGAPGGDLALAGVARWLMQGAGGD